MFIMNFLNDNNIKTAICVIIKQENKYKVNTQGRSSCPGYKVNFRIN